MLLLVIVPLLGACTLEANISSIYEDVKSIFPEKNSYLETVAASNQHSITADGYEAQVSITHYNSQQEAVTSGGYTVQTSIQSTIYRK